MRRIISSVVVSVLLLGSFTVAAAQLPLPAGAQDRGVLAIDEEAGRHAFSFDSEADAVNMCGTTGCEVVATFSACLALAYSRVTAQQEQSVWSWIEADTEGAAGREALDDCERSGGAACEVLNVYCVAAPATSRAAPAAAQQAPVPQATPEQETVFWQSIVDSTNPADFEAYLEQFPNGVFRLLAQNRLTAMREPAAGDRPVAGSGSPPAGAGRVASTPADTPPRAGESRVFDGMEFVWVPAGEFQMGSNSPLALAYNEDPTLTQVRISRGFWLGQHEVTQAEWEAVMGSNPSNWERCGARCPVEEVSWNDAQEFIGSLNGRAGGNRYRLPTEAEWEYAARAGTTGDRYGNLDGIAWHDGNHSKDGPYPVGQKAPNAWGLHDMLGNVWEWVQDWYGDYPGGTVTDPRGPVSGSYRVIRGGSYSGFVIAVQASARSFLSPDGELPRIGFRLLRTQ